MSFPSWARFDRCWIRGATDGKRWVDLCVDAGIRKGRRLADASRCRTLNRNGGDVAFSGGWSNAAGTAEALRHVISCPWLLADNLCQVGRDEENDESADSRLAASVALGIPFGLLAGIVVGLLLLDNIGLGIGIGLPFGAAVGAIIFHFRSIEGGDE
ncbi:hypothetical protein GCM10009670_10110 [Citricoccus alkalitolerans]